MRVATSASPDAGVIGTLSSHESETGLTSPTGPTALVTGASRGIGRRIALALAEAGYAVAFTARGFTPTPEDAPAKAALWLATSPEADRFLGRIVWTPRLLEELGEGGGRPSRPRPRDG